MVAVLVLAACVDLSEAGNAATAADPKADADAARRASELEPAPRIQPRDRARAATLAKEGRTKLARKPQSDLAGAARALRESARLGDPDAQLLLAQNQTLRPEGESDDAAAVAWLTRAAVRGNAAAQLELAMDYASGRRIRREPSWADMWFERAARQGNREAMLTLGRRRAAGEGRDVDELEAYRWLAIAVRAGVKDAERERAAAAKLLAPDERAGIDAEIAAWRPVATEPSPDMALIRFVQAELVANGYDAGPADGRLGARTARALAAYQRVQGERDPGEEITAATVMALRNTAAARPTP
ncbi:MAG: peptidoglycan-binding protein [Alphaproteobacteria bacterium]|nr:peptidoglycan-binding protein [Alphaproteobacteria bacterium]